MNIETIQAIKLGDAIIHGSKIYVICTACGKYVQVNKMIFGSLHICVGKDK